MTLLANADGGVDRIERRERVCSGCEGTGFDYIGNEDYWRRIPCSICEGSGVVIERHEL